MRNDVIAKLSHAGFSVKCLSVMISSSMKSFLSFPEGRINKLSAHPETVFYTSQTVRLISSTPVRPDQTTEFFSSSAISGGLSRDVFTVLSRQVLQLQGLCFLDISLYLFGVISTHSA